ncbi:DUF6541 family protein [Microbacterium sp. CFBP9034]|uniref:DUF6541 family protein n=1 Tax=Microbacterium sp. CFBP9034 TaxID=3096540 RepID=UPI002A6AF120|nr:DUF6541 family protein [Microbacterium sp. CFBP9034]MDY0908989.1 DUF6541 family protein [Microbacterium sp. CFBP9034]
MQWFAFASAALAAVAVFAVIGVPLAWIIGLRGYWLAAVAPAFAVTIVGGAAIVGTWLGVPWSPLTVLLVAAAVGLVLGVVRYATRRHAPRPAPRRRFDGWLLAGGLLAAVVIGWRFVEIIGSPENISQTFDNVFHLNAVRYVLDTGSASSLTIGRMTNPGGALGFYPAAWHGVVSVVAQLTGASIPVAINGVTFAIAAVAWPLGILLLVRTLFGRSPVLSVATGLLAASLPVFPFLLMDYGVLYPYQLGVALLPAALAVTLRLLRIVPGAVAPGAWWWAVALIGILPGLAMAHPGAFVAWLALSAPFAVVFVVMSWRASASTGSRWLIAGGSVAYLAVGAAAVHYLRPPSEARLWPLQRTMVEAVIEVLTGAAWYRTASAVAAIAVAIGIVWALIRRSPASMAAVGIFVVAGALYIICAALPWQTLRDEFTGPWYNNLPRLAALLPIGMIPLAAYGAACTWAFIASRTAVRTATANWPRWSAVGIGGVLVVVLGVAMQVGAGSPVPVAVRNASAAFASDADSALLTADERALLSRVDDHVPPDVAIAGSPWTGASLAFALADRPVLMPHLLMENTDDLVRINDGLADAEAGDAVCRAVEALGVGFVLDFGGREVHPGEHVYPGLTDLSDSDGLRLVDSQGDASLYEIVACDA